jgi:hypothetical protein
MSRRSARIETEHADAETARAIAQALSPDNTASMETAVDGRRLVTAIERDSTGGLQSTIDDYVVNLQVAVQLVTTDGETSTQIPNT